MLGFLGSDPLLSALSITPKLESKLRSTNRTWRVTMIPGLRHSIASIHLRAALQRAADEVMTIQSHTHRQAISKHKK